MWHYCRGAKVIFYGGQQNDYRGFLSVLVCYMRLYLSKAIAHSDLSSYLCARYYDTYRLQD